MTDYLNNFLRVVRNCSVVNTYKMALAKAIVELCNEASQENIASEHSIYLDEIAGKVVKYYWNQIFFFGMEENFLFHHNSPNVVPVIVQSVKKEINKYVTSHGRKPEFFERVPPSFKSQININRIVSDLKKDVIWRFPELKSETLPLYQYRKDENKIVIQKEHIKVICDNTDVLLEAINYRWSMILESFNPGTPNICKKIRIQSDQKIRRGDLKKYRTALLLENPDKVCSICGKPITDVKELSVDHVIPWSYLYSNDLWNFLFAHKNCNSQKQHTIPDEGMIKKLENKNYRLLKILKSQAEEAGNKKPSKDLTELEFAIEHGYVRRFWNMCRGF